MKRKNNYLILVLLVIFTISIGYALMNKNLFINGSSNVVKNSWDLRFENVYVNENSVEKTLPIIDNNNLSVDFSFSLHVPGDFYEFYVDVVNGGTIDAMIDSVVRTPDLTDDQKKYLNYIVEYQNGVQITSKQAILANSFVRLKVRIELRKDVNENDLPTEAISQSLGFTINCVQADNTAVEVENKGLLPIYINGDINALGTVAGIGTEQFYTIGTEGNNVKLLSMYNLYVGYDCSADSGSFDSCTAYGDEATGMQNKNMIGIGSGNVLKGVIPFTVEDMILSGGWPSDYIGSLTESYVNSYKTKLESQYDLEIEDATLLSKADLTDVNTFACNESGRSCVGSPYPWVYSTSYWTKTEYYGSDIYRVDSQGDFRNSFFNNIGYGVRPVIVISKDYFNTDK